MTSHKIHPHFWYDTEAVEAAEFYVAAFGGDSKIHNINTISDTPSGQIDIVVFDILGQRFEALNAGPHFKINPSISFHVISETVAEVEAIWNKLSPDGRVLMPLGEYPFSSCFGWVEDKYGVSWQLIHMAGDVSQRITPVLMFTQDVCGRAEEALEYYASVFPEASAQVLARYEAGEEPEEPGTVKYGQLLVDGQVLGAMDSAREHNFTFNEAISFIVTCQDQDEIDYYWEKLSAVPEAEACGWLKDQFGVSWQILPENLEELMASNPEKTTPALLEMKKIIIADLVAA